MLIVNADDWGRSREATDQAAACYAKGRITSTTAMVFMEDSARGAEIARDLGIDVGLHINFSEDFTAPSVAPELRAAQSALRHFLKASRYAVLLYHPFLRRQFAFVFRAQLAEFERLYGRPPSHLDGHQHMHLCSNVLIDRVMPRGTKVRRSFSFTTGEKSVINRAYRALVDHHLKRYHRVTDYFFALSQNLQPERLSRLARLAQAEDVELMTHPQVRSEFDYLMSDDFARMIADVPLGTYQTIR